MQLTIIDSFYRVFHPHLPIIDITIPAHDYQKSSPFLFWTVLFIASRHHAAYLPQSNALMPAYTNLMNRTLFSQMHSLHTIQAMLCLCTWPMPVMSQLDDQSLMLAGAAVNAAYMLALPRSLHSTSSTFAVVPQEHRVTMSKTWLACFNVQTVLECLTTTAGAPR